MKILEILELGFEDFLWRLGISAPGRLGREAGVMDYADVTVKEYSRYLHWRKIGGMSKREYPRYLHWRKTGGMSKREYPRYLHWSSNSEKAGKGEEVGLVDYIGGQAGG
ncbi:hypothetical protein [Paenibacillus taihuensis]|uniref:hypothetical protein n=1 Tax=Paenibacillus taihuensis TaxID=1156355 RepID=UPI000E26666C|nr:hypothetical protein [Paenibacillus taihuensis]